MGDRCYMQIKCRKQDVPVFEEIGFQVDDSEVNGESVHMFEEEANYAHSGDMPTDIPWTGSSGAGGSYGPSEYACDGKELVEVECGYHSGYVIGWDHKLNEPLDGDLAHLRHFTDVCERAEAMLAGKEVAA